MTFLCLSGFGQDPGLLLRKQWFSARRKEKERKESMFFLPRGKVLEEPGDV